MIRILLLIALTGALAFGSEGEKDKPAAQPESDTVQTPFGPAKKQDPADKPAPPISAAKPLVEISLDGDTYTFSRPTPFGAQTWKRLKADLSADEKKLIEAQEAWEKRQAEKAKPAQKPEPRA